MRLGLPETGDIVAHKFRIDRLVGRGGMGSVYAVTHLITGKTLALKCLLPQLATDTNAVERFMREAQAIGRIQHRHVVDIFDVIHDNGLCCIVMPFLDGFTLSDLLKEGALTLQRALVVLARAMEGVAAAHAAGIIHRDLKPCNIFVCRGLEGEYDDPRVLDFGISKLVTEEPSRLTASGAALGTPSYMAVEQLAGDPSTDERADVFSMGVIVYEALTGRLPHVAQNAAGLAMARLTSPPTDVAVFRPELPRNLRSAVMRSLATKREERPRSMAELASALRECLNDPAVVHAGVLRATAVSSPTTLEESAPAGALSRPRTPATVPLIAPRNLTPAPISNGSEELLLAHLRDSGWPVHLSPRSALGLGALFGLMIVIAAFAWFVPDAPKKTTSRPHAVSNITHSPSAPVPTPRTTTAAPPDASDLQPATTIDRPPTQPKKAPARPAPTAAPDVPKLPEPVAVTPVDAAVTAPEKPATPARLPPTANGLRPEDF